MGEALVIAPAAYGTITKEDEIRSSVYGIRIDMSSSSPSDAVIYTQAASNFEPLSNNASTGICSYGDWAEIIDALIGCKPCLYLNGARSKYLNPDNYAKDTSGNSVDITSGSAGDVMIEFRKTWYRWRVSGNYLYFEITGEDKTGVSGWCCDAFKTSGGTVQDYMYYGAYEGYVASNKLRSLSGKTPTVSQTIGTFRTYATNMGSKYQQEEIAKRMYIIGLIFLVSKSRDAQSTLGAGWTGGSAAATTGTCNAKGLFFGSSANTAVAKVFGIENFWGSLYKWCDGFVSGGSTNLLYKVCGPYNDAGTDYSTATGILASSYPKTMTNLGDGIIAALSSGGSGSNSTYFPDNWYLDSTAGRVCAVGGHWYRGLVAGPLCCDVDGAASSAGTRIGGRLSAC